jgi:hypothetical protein
MAEEPPQREPSRCFVIMPIGREETDRVWAEAYEPTIKGSGLDAFRIDKRDDGGLLTQQIVHQIQVSYLLVADLTFARPNCYYELGFAHGVNRSFRVILCCREDHLPDSPLYDRTNKIHFDLQNHGILFWKAADLEPFKRALRERIEQRLDLIRREEAAERDAERGREAQQNMVTELVTRDVRASLEERLKLLTRREQERLAGTWKKGS